MTWCKQYHEVNYCPADPFFICIYFNDLILEKQSINAISTALCGIRWGHLKAGYDSPTDCQLVKLAFKGAQRVATVKDKNRKEPFTSEMIGELVKRYGSSDNLINHRFIVICVIGFAGFLRISELLNLQIQDIKFKESWYEITIKKSKTDQIREGNIVFIAKTSTPTCPVFWLKKYLSSTGLQNQPTSYLLCRLAKTKKGHNAIGKHPISYQTARKTFLEHINFLNPENDYGLHSLRSGGATAAANSGIPERLIGKHGRCSSATSREVCIKDAKQQRLRVSKSLGL